MHGEKSISFFQTPVAITQRGSPFFLLSFFSRRRASSQFPDRRSEDDRDKLINLLLSAVAAPS